MKAPAAEPGAAGTAAAGGTAGSAHDDIGLTPTEWHLLEMLLRNPGKLPAATSC